jgi:hypothetical protein
VSNSSPIGFSIRIFLAEGIPDGLRLVEKSNWTGRGVICPRSRFPDMKTREEFGRTGVYILAGPTEEKGLPTVYIGEGDPVRPRLEQHNAQKDFWTSVFVFGSKDDNLNKAHVQYIEARLIRLAGQVKRCILDNVNVPALPSLSEADKADVEGFLEEMLLILPIMGVGVFDRPAPPPPRKQLLHLKVKNISAKGYESPQGFVVLKESLASLEEAEYIHNYMRTLRATLKEKGILTEQTDHLVLTQDFVFDSPSSASGVLLGRTSNGRKEWKDEDGVCLKDIQGRDVPDESEAEGTEP